MKKLLLISTVVLLMFAVLVPASAAPKGPPTGFILQDTDAAYAAFDAGNGCIVFVGYVSTERLKRFGVPGGFHPHSDLEVTLTGPCEASGVVDTLDDVRAGITELDEAYVDGIVVPLGGVDEATVTLDWEATDPIVDWKVKEPGMHAKHTSTLATVTGTVVITGSTNVTVGDGDVIYEDWFTETGGLLEGPIITHYDELNLRP